MNHSFFHVPAKAAHNLTVPFCNGKSTALGGPTVRLQPRHGASRPRSETLRGSHRKIADLLRRASGVGCKPLVASQHLVRLSFHQKLQQYLIEFTRLF